MRNNKTVLFLLAVSVFILLGISGGLLNVAWTYMKDTFQVDVSAIGILLLCATSGSFIAAMGSGTLTGKLSLGRVATLGVFLVTIGLLGVATNSVWSLLLIIFLFMYMGRGLLDASMNNFVADHFGTTAMNWLHASWGVGLTIAPGIMTYILITLALPWQVGYLFAFAVAFVLLCVFFFTMRQWNLSHQEMIVNDVENSTLKPPSLMETVQQPGVIGYLVLFFVYGGVEIGTGQLVNTLFVDGRAMPQEIASFWLSAYWGSFTVGRILMGWIALRFTDVWLMRFSLTLALVGGFLLMWNTASSFSLMALLLMGIGFAGVFPILISQTPIRVGKRYASQAVGLQIGIAGLGGAVLPGILSFTASNINLEWIAYGLFVSVLLLILLYVILQKQYPLDVETKNK